MPEDLINPISTITGQVPEMRDVGNWYFNLPGFRELLGEYVEEMEERDDVRRVVTDTISEFLVPPVIFVKNECREDYESIRCRLPEHVFHEAEKGKQSFELAFADINLRDEARDILSEEGIRYRTGKALVPFRLTGNIEWGVPAPRLEDEESLTVWCWPESLWAPISFTRAFLAAHGHGDDEWRDWWCTSEARVFQFIGQDNIYFYGVAQPAMWSAMQSGHAPRPDGDEGELRQSTLIAHHHVLFMNKKASSSGSVKPPMAIELLDHYTPEQLRAHFLSLGLGIKSVSFSPKSYDPDALAVRESDPERYSKIADPVLKDGQPLTNVLNRLVRSALYAAQKASGVTVDNERTGEVANGAVSYLPLVDPSPELVGNARETLLRYELLMYRTEMHTATNTVFDYIRGASKYANAHCTPPKDGVATDRQLADYFFLVRICAMLVHPIAPAGAEMIAGYLGFDPRELFAWEKTVTDDGIVDIAEFCTDEERRAGRHALVTLLPRVDFFEKHPSQY
jgi:methionyl-tRNA synthetase